MALPVRAAFGWIGQVLAWLVILGVVVVLAVAVVVPRLAGATPYTVLTGSMQPTYPPGMLVVVKPVDFDDIGVGDVITFQLESGKAAVATHRVVGEALRFDGERVLVTQGDANDDPDPNRVRDVQVKGELWYSVPYLGHVNTALSGRQRQWAVLGVSAALVGYAAFMFVSALRDRRRVARESPDLVTEGSAALDGEAAEEPDGPTGPGPHTNEVPRRFGPAAVVGTAAAVLAALVLIRVRARRTIEQTGRTPS